ncbi:MAG: CPBP family intramembrane metalloprotease [Desulfobulbaceae bacterium]|nr:CPBP family intramembrane metalloprotease [Desulfobulbaceae bacterium]
MILDLTKKILLFFIIVILALFVYQYHAKAFPEFSPNFSLKKSAVIEKANSYARSFGLDPETYYQALTFNEATEDKFFIEREYGLERLKAEVDAGVSIWSWRVRNFVPGEKEEFSLKLDTEGNLVGFNHQVEETTARPRLTKEEALGKAEQFLETYIKQHPREKLELAENGENEKPGYYSYSFTWERTDWHWGTGIYHLHLRVDGDQVGEYYEHLKEPEEWRRDFAKQRSENRIYGVIAWSAAALLAVGVVVMFIRIIVKDRRFWHNFPLKWTMPVSFLLLISSFSRFPDLLSQYSTQHNFYVFITNSIIGTTFATVGAVMGFIIVAFMADVFWQKSFPEHVSVRSLLSGRGLASKEVIRSVPWGFFLALAALAYVTAYYLIGSRFNIWVPSSIDYSQVVTSYFPAMEALTVGIRAAWMEEFFFRILALVLIFRLTGSKWLAIIVSAAVWGFMHSNYPQMPGYARGIELTLEGIVYGWVAVRFGILTTFISHCLFNTWLGAIFAWRIGSPFHVVMAIAVSIWPLAIWGVAKIKISRLGRFISPAELLAKVTLGQQVMAAKAIIAAKHRRPRRSVVVGSTLAAVAMFMALAMVPEPPLADLGSITLSPKDAKNFSDAVFQEQTGLDPDLYRRSVQHYSGISGADTEYLLEHTDAETLAGHIRSSLLQEYWYV